MHRLNNSAIVAGNCQFTYSQNNVNLKLETLGKSRPKESKPHVTMQCLGTGETILSRLEKQKTFKDEHFDNKQGGDFGSPSFPWLLWPFSQR
eukprot:3390664-Amphidinium_carterae.1